MLRILKGKNITHEDSINNYINGFKRIEVDLGTGDGRFVYTLAKQNPDVFYIGIDPVAENMAEHALKINKKLHTGFRLTNVMYLVAAAEDLPQEISGVANKIYVTLPWGSLLEGIVKADPLILGSLLRIAKKPLAEFEFCFTYDVLYESAEIANRDLPILAFDYVKNELAKAYEKFGFLITRSEVLCGHMLRTYPTKWAKKLGYGRDREIFMIKGTIDSNNG